MCGGSYVIELKKTFPLYVEFAKNIRPNASVEVIHIEESKTEMEAAYAGLHPEL